MDGFHAFGLVALALFVLVLYVPEVAQWLLAAIVFFLLGAFVGSLLKKLFDYP